MRHRVRKVKLSRSAGHRGLLIRNLATSLILEEKIKTTVPKAKAARAFVERLITLAKKNNTARARLLESRLGKKEVVQKLLRDIAPRFLDRQGGFTRIVHIGERAGDAARMALIELTVPPLPKKDTEKSKSDKGETEIVKAVTKKTSKKPLVQKGSKPERKAKETKARRSSGQKKKTK